MPVLAEKVALLPGYGPLPCESSTPFGALRTGKVQSPWARFKFLRIDGVDAQT